MTATRLRPVIIGVLACTPFSLAQEPDPVLERLEDSPRHHEWVDVGSADGRVVETFVVFPESHEPTAAVIIIHENRGLNDWARAVADQIAELGYVALAPDLLSGTGPDGGGTSSFDSTDAARNGIYALPPGQVLNDLRAVVDHARNMGATTDVVMVGGFCWGGSQTFRYATHDRSIGAAFVFYGGAPDDDEALAQIEAPVYGFYGADDHRITGAVPEVQQKMEALGKTYDAIVYPGAQHAFMRRGMTAEHEDPNGVAMRNAWERWAELLRSHDGADED